MKSSKGKAILISIGAWVLIVIILIMRLYFPFFAFFTVCDVIDSFTKTPIIDVVTVDKCDVLDKYDIDILKSDVIKNKCQLRKIITEFILQKTLLIISLY